MSSVIYFKFSLLIPLQTPCLRYLKIVPKQQPPIHVYIAKNQQFSNSVCLCVGKYDGTGVDEDGSECVPHNFWPNNNDTTRDIHTPNTCFFPSLLCSLFNFHNCLPGCWGWDTGNPVVDI